MTRWLLHPLALAALAALLCCLCALPALGQSAVDLSDDFDDGVVDSSKWFTYTFPEATGSIEERDGMLVMTRETGDYCANELWSLWALRGAFDVQVDYQLLEWPLSRYLGVFLVAVTPDNHSNVGHYQNTGSEERVAGYLRATQCICGGRYPTADRSGRLRLVRDADNNLTAYFWSAETASWVAFESAVAPGDAKMMLWFVANTDQPAQVAFDNFRVNSGELIPTPDPNDYFDDGVVDTSRWYVEGDSIVEADGKLTVGGLGGGLRARWKLRGPFEYQVDYELLDWPVDRYAGLGLLAELPSDTWSNWSVQRASIDYGEPSWQCYLADYVPPPGDTDFIYGLTPTTNTAGTLRLARDENSVLTVSVRSPGASDWAVIHSAPMTAEDVRPIVACWSDGEAPIAVAFDNFEVHAGEFVSLAPVIEDVVIDRGRDTDWWDWARYHQRVTVQVRGSTDEQPACAIIEDPDGSRYVISTCNPVGWYDWIGANAPGIVLPELTVGPDYTYTYTWYEGRKWQAPASGSYQITVIGNNGTQPLLTTPVAPPVPEEGPALIAPVMDGVADTAVPAFAWLPPAGSESWLQLRAEGDRNFTGPVADDMAEVWHAAVGQQTTAVYNFDGSGPDLDLGRTYFWQVNAWTPVDDRVSDPLVSIWNEQTASHRFTIDAQWPSLPELPGRLAYTQTEYGDWSTGFDAMAIAQYGPTVDTRKWIAPYTSECPDFSWDGTKLQYRLCDAGTWIDNLDGTPPNRVPDNDSWADSNLSPDATSIVYSQATDPNWVLEVWTQQLDGSDARLLVPVRGRRARYPDWSPDGVWITYASCCDPTGYNIWLIHPDGTEDHPVVPTTVAGYPGWEVVWLGSASVWSPDAARLLTSFSAIAPGGSEFIDALGTISRDGGEVTPVWVNPPGNVCCAAAFPNTWSPDGHSVVFASGHHLTPDPDWLNGEFETGVELWLAPADGSGPPVRLTYDYSYANGSSWWAPNTLIGKGVSVVKGDATLTFAQVMAEGSTRMNVTGDVPGPAPEGCRFVSDIWSSATTAGYLGDITVGVEYDASLDGHSLALMQWNAGKGKWQDITARPVDVTHRVISGHAKDLGLFAVCLKTR